MSAPDRLGLVLREPHPGDGRARALSITPDGRASADRAVVAVEACDRNFFGRLRSQVADLTVFLQRLSAGD